MSKKTICIGIVAYNGLDGQVATDYMRLVYHLGRRHPEYDFQIAIKHKKEQFRARNEIVQLALQFGADYIWMLDDDHIIDITDSIESSDAYDLPIKLVKHLENNDKIGVVGALYYQRGGTFYPVIMQELPDDDKPFFLTHSEVADRMQRVDVTGGGCMMIRAELFDKIETPWFAPEHDWGTDVQLCKQARKAGYEVWCDTSLKLGHLQHEKHLVTERYVQDHASKDNEPLRRYREDVQEYLGMNGADIMRLAEFYDAGEIVRFDDFPEYYRTRGKPQLARQFWYHHQPKVIGEMELFHRVVRTDIGAYGLDFGCGSAPVGFELALRGNKMDFVDVDGAEAFEFTKWRAKKHKIDCGFELKGPYDYVMCLDSIEHIPNWKEVLTDLVGRIKPGGVFITNFFYNNDFNNPEHVSMDHASVKQFLESEGFKTEKELFWVKDAAQEVAA